MADYVQLQQQLHALVIVLQQAELWQSGPISPSALSSQLPFGVDCLRFEQWLQFVFIPRMNALIDARADLPKNVALTPYAEEVFRNYEQPTSDIIQQLKAIDDIFIPQP
ncbi:YqcC family protein [Celerinatantimonas sp. YJH-8]|uniref:YqcC family protein n=1 Tax=Celerinatantimonas sp. YJH-8 TaxID=3228714 RepID=UPI0038C92630